jgi:glycosyltransferase involved in cell wall biosynthesis
MPDKFPKVLVNFWCFFHFRYSFQLIAVSNAVKEKLEKHHKVIVIYNEVPFETEMKIYPYNEQSKIILYLSNYIPGKGLEYAIVALSSLGSDYEQWNLRFVGSDMGLEKNKSYKRRLQQMAQELGVLGRIHWGEFTKEVSIEYAQAGLVLNLSESESFSLTCLEAMYCNRPVMATACGGPQEIITQGVDGELVQLGSQQKINTALAMLLKDVNLRRRYAANARKSVIKRFGLHQTAYKLIPIFEEAIKG